eukprot:14756045-Ditylum_brightwellii.AAC.1
MDLILVVLVTVNIPCGSLGVDWVDDASCCQLCNRGNWGQCGDNKVYCEPKTVPQLICNSKHISANKVLYYGVNAEE